MKPSGGEVSKGRLHPSPKVVEFWVKEPLYAATVSTLSKHMSCTLVKFLHTYTREPSYKGHAVKGNYTAPTSQHVLYH